MTTAADLVNEAKRYLLSSHREQLNSLNGAINAAVTTITLNYALGSLGGGAVIAVDLEIMYVWSADAASMTAVVQRGFQGSTAAVHSDDAIVTVNPKFPDFAVLQAINADLRDISGDIFQVKTERFTYISGKQGYDITGSTGLTIISSLNAYYDYPGIQRSWPQLNGYHIRRDANTTDFPSGYAIILSEAAFAGRGVQVTYSADLGTLTALTDNVTTVTGLPDDAMDIPALGAAMRLQGVREGQRNFNDSQPDTRRAAEVPTGAQLQSMRGVMDFHEKRIISTRKSLIQRYPYMRRIENTWAVG